jgi:hypothetical protein
MSRPAFDKLKSNPHIDTIFIQFSILIYYIINLTGEKQMFFGEIIVNNVKIVLKNVNFCLHQHFYAEKHYCSFFLNDRKAALKNFAASCNGLTSGSGMSGSCIPSSFAM